MSTHSLPKTLITALVLTLTLTTHAIPTLDTRAAPPTSAVWKWSNDPTQCKTTTCTSDCQSAAQKLCSIPNGLSTTQSVTVGTCTAFYWIDTGNTLPSVSDCNAAFTTITGPASTPGSSGDCPGYVGGVLGYDAGGKRTNDPLYMVSPNEGNGNCFKAPGDTSPVLGKDELPNGQTLGTCPVSSSKRGLKDTALEKRDGADVKCGLESAFVGSPCTTMGLITVTTAGWEYVIPSKPLCSKACRFADMMLS